MKKFFALAAGLLVGSALCNAATPVFSQSFVDGADIDIDAWTIIDANNDEKTWKLDKGAAPSQVYYTYHSKNVADDWLISPQFTLPEAGMYMVRYTVCGNSYGEAIEVWTGTSATVDAMTDKRQQLDNVLGSSTANYFIVEATAGQKLHLGFRAISQPDKYRLFLVDVEVIPANNPVDLAVTEIVSPKTGEGLGTGETVTVKIENKGMVDLASFDINYSVNDGATVTETVNTPLAKGESLQYTFAAKADMSQPRGKYLLKAWTSHPDDIDTSNDAISATIRHIAEAGVPYYMGFEADEDTGNFTFLNLNGDDGVWAVEYNDVFARLSRTGDAYLGYNYNSDNAADDWFFLEPMTLDPGYYSLKFWYSATEGNTERFRVCYGSEPTAEAMTNVLYDFKEVNNSSYQQSINIFEIKAQQKVYIGFYAYSEANQNWLVIDDLSLEAIDANKLDLVVSSFKEPFGFLRENNTRNVSFDIHNYGIAAADAVVTLTIDGTAHTKNVNVPAQADVNIKFDNILAGLELGSHTLKVSVACDKDTDLSNNEVEKTIEVLGTPVKFWDFENAKLADDIVCRVEDKGTVNPDAGDEFNKDGFGIFKLRHEMLGQYAMAVATWVDGVDNVNRYVVLPQMKVTGKNAFFVWDANSFSTSESYDVRVSKRDDNWMDYSTVLTINGELRSPQTRGIYLADYEGNDVYIAINVTTPTNKGEALILDNLGVYGDIQPLTSGIGEISDAADALYFDGNALRVAAEADIEVSSVAGATVAAGHGTSLDITSLPAGVYIAKASTANGIKTLKFIKK